ncbi:MAG: GNAT family N-acetyltransferase [Chlamydiia bacterium]|nr:GNAT family N-acetyltransferase [Chlamydiia bacterium]
MTFLTDFDIRYSVEEDAAPLKRWLSVEGACDDFPFETTDLNEVVKNWIGFARYKASLTGILGSEPCAVGTLFLMPYKKVAHQCSFNLIVDPVYRRKGIGTSMVRNLLHLAKTRFRLESVYAELYEPSHLLALVEKLGFQIFARQENFIHVNGCPRPRVLLEYFFP